VKIGFTGIDLPEGKTKYKDEKLIALEAKDKAKKVAPFFAEFIKDEFVQSDAIVVPKSNILDLLILDMDKIEARLLKLEDGDERSLMTKCMELLEKEIPLCDVDFNDEEEEILVATAPISFKPIVQVEGSEDINTIIFLALEKANQMFFYTSGPKESHAWLVQKGSEIIACAEKIHSDLARGFIKGDVVSFEDYMNCHNFNDCKSKGVAKLVDRDYVIQPNDIIEIRFNV
jgi:ribosome-binding ATPase YchF (GTP1/OBG family)